MNAASTPVPVRIVAFAAQIAGASARVGERLRQVRRFCADWIDIRPRSDILTIAAAAAALAAPIILAHGLFQTTLQQASAGLHLALAAFSIATIESLLRLCQSYRAASDAWRTESHAVRTRIDFGVAAVAAGLLIGWTGWAAAAPIGIALTGALALLWLTDCAAPAVETADAIVKKADQDIARARNATGWVKAAGLEMAFARQYERALRIAGRYRADALFAASARRSIALGVQDIAMLAMGAAALTAAARGDMTIGMAAACILLAGRIGAVASQIARRDEAIPP